MKRVLLVLIAALLVLSARADTIVPANTIISANQTWTTAGSPYILQGAVTVSGANNPVLTIEEGVEVRGANQNAIVVVNEASANKGTLLVNGTADRPVRFSSTGATTPGSWKGLYIGDKAGATPSRITHAEIAYAGSTGQFLGGITTKAESLKVEHVTIRNNAYAGAVITGGHAYFTSCAIRANQGPGIYGAGGTALTTVSNFFDGNTGYAVSLPAAMQFHPKVGSIAIGNGHNAIEYRADTISTDMTWAVPGVNDELFYAVTGSIKVQAANQSAPVPTLTIEPGVTVKFNAGAELVINWAQKGALIAQGKQGSSIVFTSNTTATPGAWRGLWFGAKEGPQSKLAHAIVRYGGTASQGGVTIEGRSPLLDQVLVEKNQGAGILIKNGSPSITGSTIATNSGYGIYAENGTLELNGNTFTDNVGYAASLPALSLVSAGGNSATGHGMGRDAIEYREATLHTSRTWPKAGINLPYAVTGLIDVRAADAVAPAPVLTIAAGTVIKFNPGGRLRANLNERGAIQATGTAGERIVFTANQTTASPASPGHWNGITLGNRPNAPASTFSYVTIEYGGSTFLGGNGGITVNGGSPMLDHLIVRHSLSAGVDVRGGSASVTDSEISTTQGFGLVAWAGSSVALSRTAFTNNTDRAVYLSSNAALLAADGLSASGNAVGGNGLCIDGDTMTTSKTWPHSTLPYILSSLQVGGTEVATLTIEPGNRILFNPGGQLFVNSSGRGALQAIGTPEAPIVFTANVEPGVTPNRGHWNGIWLGSAANPPIHRMSYATIEYAGTPHLNGRAGITIFAGSPELDHLIVRNNLHAGVASAVNGGTPRISNSQFYGNDRDVLVSQGTVQATLNYWSSPNGPRSTGCASGFPSVTGDVRYEPWLVAPPSEPFFLASAFHRNPIFNPSIGTESSVDYTTSLSGNVMITIRDAQNALVRTLSAGSPGSIAWDGTNESGTSLPDGNYTYDVAATAPRQAAAVVARGRTVIDRTRLLTVSNPTLSEAFFSPNGDAAKDTATVSATANYGDVAWTVSVVDPANNVVRTHNASGETVSFAWNGRSDASAMQADGLYAIRIEATVGSTPPMTASVSRQVTTTLDNTPPVAVLTSPQANTTISNVFTNGVTTVAPSGTASDLNLLNWEVQIGTVASPPFWFNAFSGGTQNVQASVLGSSWQTASADGTWGMRLTVRDKAGNVAAATQTPLTVGHFRATQNNVYELNPSANGTITYRSTIPFQMTESIEIRNLSGAPVRHLVVPVVRAAGTYNDIFDGRDDAGNLLPDGPYFFFPTVTAAGSTFTLDLSNVMRTDSPHWNDLLNIQAYDPFNNKPLTFNYNFPTSGRLTVATSTEKENVRGFCDQPSAVFFCPAFDEWQESGPQTFTWWGIDHTGAYRAIRGLGIVSLKANFPTNAAVLFGSKPTVKNVKVTPPVFGPEVGEQAVEFDLTTRNSRPAQIKVEFVNLTTKSTLRTLTVPEQEVGHATIIWDGRSDSGMYVAPGRYNVIVTATDGIGNVVRSGILTEIQY